MLVNKFYSYGRHTIVLLKKRTLQFQSFIFHFIIVRFYDENLVFCDSYDFQLCILYTICTCNHLSYENSWFSYLMAEIIQILANCDESNISQKVVIYWKFNKFSIHFHSTQPLSIMHQHHILIQWRFGTQDGHIISLSLLLTSQKVGLILTGIQLMDTVLYHLFFFRI
jgi:hypothetical protein